MNEGALRPRGLSLTSARALLFNAGNFCYILFYFITKLNIRFLDYF